MGERVILRCHASTLSSSTPLAPFLSFPHSCLTNCFPIDIHCGKGIIRKNNNIEGAQQATSFLKQKCFGQWQAFLVIKMYKITSTTLKQKKVSKAVTKLIS